MIVNSLLSIKYQDLCGNSHQNYSGGHTPHNYRGYGFDAISLVSDDMVVFGERALSEESQ